MLQQNQTISIKNLADQVGVSKRTIQRELEYIDSSLKKYQIHFHSRTGVGVWLEGNEEEKLRLLQDITTGDTYDVSNREAWRNYPRAYINRPLPAENPSMRRPAQQK